MSDKLQLYAAIQSIYTNMPDTLPDNWSRIEFVPEMGLLATVQMQRHKLNVSVSLERSVELSRMEALRLAKSLANDVRFPTGLRHPKDDMSDKGEFAGRCNVNACQRPGSAFYANKMMKHKSPTNHYCIHCAIQIQEASDGKAFDKLPDRYEFVQYLSGNL